MQNIQKASALFTLCPSWIYQGEIVDSPLDRCSPHLIIISNNFIFHVYLHHFDSRNQLHSPTYNFTSAMPRLFASKQTVVLQSCHQRLKIGTFGHQVTCGALVLFLISFSASCHDVNHPTFPSRQLIEDKYVHVCACVYIIPVSDMKLSLCKLTNSIEALL